MVYKQTRYPKSTHITVSDHALCEPWLSTLISRHLNTWARSTNFLILHSHAEPVNKVLQRVGQKHRVMKWNMSRRKSLSSEKLERLIIETISS
jgi:hypothetical protein